MLRNEPAIVVSGPSGAGKTEIVKAVLLRASQEPELFEPRLGRVVTSTTREPRAGERHGQDYFFHSEEEFCGRLVEGRFLEHVTSPLNGKQYGTEQEAISAIIERGEVPFLNLDLEGAHAVKAFYKHSLRIFLMPGSFEDLRKRMEGRDDVEGRLAQGRIDMERWRHFCNAKVMNYDGHFEKTVISVITEIQKYLKK